LQAHILPTSHVFSWFIVELSSCHVEIISSMPTHFFISFNYLFISCMGVPYFASLKVAQMSLKHFHMSRTPQINALSTVVNPLFLSILNF